MKTIAETAHAVWYNKKVRHEVKCFLVGFVALAIIAGVIGLFQKLGPEITVYCIVWAIALLAAWVLGHLLHFTFSNKR